MELGEFNSDYLANLLEKLSLENKTLVLLGDLNANLLKYDIDTDGAKRGRNNWGE